MLGFLLKIIPDWVFHWINDSPLLHSFLNRLIIGSASSAARPRPHPWSTAHDYVSWKSLSDKRFSSRHLPPKAPAITLPPVEDTVAVFERRTGSDGKLELQQLCPKSTLLFPAFAQYLTDGFMRTMMTGSRSELADMKLRRRNTSPHQIDLCPLYGINELQSFQLRERNSSAGRRGRLKSQIINGEEYSPYLYRDDGTPKPEFDQLCQPMGDGHFSDLQKQTIFAVGGDRVNTQPQVVMINTLFLREHNRIAGELCAAYADWTDERVFQTARNILIVLFIKIVVEDYINHINSTPFRLKADPSIAWGADWNWPAWISVEFSLLYRWHGLMPEHVDWAGRPIALGDTIANNAVLLESGSLLNAFSQMSSQAAARIVPFNCAQSLLRFENKAITQARAVNLQGYNAYRKYVGLDPAGKFADISPNADVQTTLEGLYQHPDNVEFYTGLFCEPAGHNGPLPELLSRMVALDAFTQALTNPLLQRSVFNRDTFSTVGWETIQETSTLTDIVARHYGQSATDAAQISMTQRTWRRQ